MLYGYKEGKDTFLEELNLGMIYAFQQASKV